MEKCRIQPKCFPSPPRHGQFTSKKQNQTNGNGMCYPVDQQNELIQDSRLHTLDSQSHVIIYYISPKNVIYFGWVSYTPFGVPFRLPVQFQDRGSSPFIICKDFQIISKVVCCVFYMKKNVAFRLISFPLLI